MRIGTICYATNSGLGILAKSFFDHGIVTDPLVLLHSRHPSHHVEWYPGRPVVADANAAEVADFCALNDVMLFFETPFDWHLLDFCRARGIKTVLMPMHECTPDPMPAIPDAFFCPSDLDLGCFKDMKVPCHMTPVPVEVNWRKRVRADVFVHNAGHGGLRNRNGTGELIEAWRLMGNSAPRLILRSQKPLQWNVAGLNIDVRIGTFPRDALYDEGDVFVFPEKFNGLSLPLQEAHAAGMLVMATNRYPMNTWLPNEPLIPSYAEIQDRISSRYRIFQSAVVEPTDIAKHVGEWAGKDITYFSDVGQAWAQCMSWDELTPFYLELLTTLRGEPCESCI